MNDLNERRNLQQNNEPNGESYYTVIFDENYSNDGGLDIVEKKTLWMSFASKY